MRPRPLLSICIPTFNRAPFLHGILSQLLGLDADIKQLLEICISDNASTDNTPILLESSVEISYLKYIRQSENIGASANLVEVTKLATGFWLILIGDDDRFCVSGLVTLLSHLEQMPKDTWVLANVIDINGSLYFSKLKKGLLPKSEIIPGILSGALNMHGLGFIAVHIIPTTLREQLITFDLSDIRGWPHVALFSWALFRVDVFFFPVAIAKQEIYGTALTWQKLDFLRLLCIRARLFINYLECTAKARGQISGYLFQSSYIYDLTRDCFRLGVSRRELLQLYSEQIAGLEYVAPLKKCWLQLSFRIFLFGLLKRGGRIDAVPDIPVTDGCSRGL